MQTAAAAKLAASVAMAQPPPAVATTMPAMVGPRILVALREAASSEFARCSAVGVTNCGTMPHSAGMVNAAAHPLAASSTASAHSR